MRLRRTDLSTPGYSRQGAGRGFSLRDTDDSPLTDAAAVERIKALVLPPAGSDRSDRRWHEIHADDIDDYLREISGEQMTAKDFRTWHGTVAAARSLAEAGPQPTEAKRRRVVSHAMKEVADLLGNTPAVARSSYVDPRVLEAYEQGEVVSSGSERAVRKLLES